MRRGPRPRAPRAAFIGGLLVFTWLVVFTGLLAGLAGCAGNGKGIVEETLGGGGGGGGGGLQPTLQSLQQNIFGQICINCHFPGGTGPMPLDTLNHTYSSLVGVPSIELPNLLRVAPGDPANSYIVLKITADPTIIGDRMPPPPENALSSEEIQAIVDWIAMGAKK